jgi:hypothetical protein
MGWINFQSNGYATTPQADDTEICTVLETNESGISFPYDIRIVDIVLDKTASQNHQYSFWVNGKKMSSNFYSAQINPATQGRLNFANQGIVIKAGSRIQLRAAQKSGTSAEATIVLVQFLP